MTRKKETWNEFINSDSWDEPTMTPGYAPPPLVDGQVGERRKLPTCEHLDPSMRSVRVYVNGNKDQLWTIACYGAERIFDTSLFEFVFLREAFRLWGPTWEQGNPDEAEKWISEKIRHILYLLDTDPLGVFNKKVAGDETSWSNLASFANLYWWLDENARNELDGDIESANAAWAEFVIDWARPRTPMAVIEDPTYSSTRSLLAQNNQIDVDKLRGKGFAQGVWPVELPSGLPASIPGLPPICEPFPSCVLAAFPMAASAMWKLVDGFAATPGVKQVRSQEGVLYLPAAAPKDVATDAEIEQLGLPEQKDPPPTWGWAILAVGVAIVGSYVIFTPSKGVRSK